MAKIRIFLPNESKVKSSSHIYTIYDVISMSKRSITYECINEKGIKYRFKYFNGESYLKYNDFIQITQVKTNCIMPVDIGYYSDILFVVYPIFDVEDISKTNVSINDIRNKVVWPLVNIIHKFHEKGILLRDICPEHILYLETTKQLAYCGLNNLILLNDKSTVTTQKGYFEDNSYLAPEIMQDGYSFYSDYYALGATLYYILFHKKLFDGYTNEEIVQNISNRTISGIDYQVLNSLSYENHSERSKICYLIMGLITTSAENRWGYEEIIRWCQNQPVTWITNEHREIYEFNEPFVLDDIKYWNAYDIVNKCVSIPWDSNLYDKLVIYLRKNDECYAVKYLKIERSKDDYQAKIFKILYTMHPTLDGLWWNGNKYIDSTELAQKAKNNDWLKLSVSTMLKNNCFSFYQQIRKNDNETSSIDFTQFESWETQKKNRGVSRFVIKFGGIENNRIKVENVIIEDFDSFIETYQNKPNELRTLSKSLINEETYLAWLWAKGENQLVDTFEGLLHASYDVSFMYLLMVLEKYCLKKTSLYHVRYLYLKYGDFSPVYWLSQHLDCYKYPRIKNTLAFRRFNIANFELSNSIEALSHTLKDLIVDYQEIVMDTRKNADEKTVCIPISNDYKFDLKWNDFYVCKQFMQTWE